MKLPLSFNIPADTAQLLRDWKTAIDTRDSLRGNHIDLNVSSSRVKLTQFPRPLYKVSTARSWKDCMGYTKRQMRRLRHSLPVIRLEGVSGEFIVDQHPPKVPVPSTGEYSTPSCLSLPVTFSYDHYVEDTRL